MPQFDTYIENRTIRMLSYSILSELEGFFYLGKCAVFCFCTLVSKSAIAVHLTIVILPLWMHSLASLNEVNENLGVDSIKYLANKLSHPIFPEPSDWIFGLFFSLFQLLFWVPTFLEDIVVILSRMIKHIDIKAETYQANTWYSDICLCYTFLRLTWLWYVYSDLQTLTLQTAQQVLISDYVHPNYFLTH